MPSYKLGGRLVGYGIKRNGIESVVMLNKPIHNTITKSCLDNLLMHNGSNALPSGYEYNTRVYQVIPSLFISNYNLTGTQGQRFGVFQFCALGNGTGATSVDDTDLHNRLTDYSNVAPTGNTWNGGTLDSTNHILICRRSHTHTIASDMVVTEIGWFHRIYPSGAYSLSSRVVLDSPITLHSGDVFYTIYEWVVSITPKTEHSDWFGLGPVVEFGMIGSLSNSGSDCSYPSVDRNGAGSLVGTYADKNWPIMEPVFTPNVAGDAYNEHPGINTIIIADRDTESMWGSYVTNGYKIGYPNIIGMVTSDYTPGSFYRERSFTVSPGFAGGNSIYSWFLNGTVYRFGKWENGVFTAMPFTPSSSDSYRITVRQSWSTDLLTPSA